MLFRLNAKVLIGFYLCLLSPFAYAGNSNQITENDHNVGTPAFWEMYYNPKDPNWSSEKDSDGSYYIYTIAAKEIVGQNPNATADWALLKTQARKNLEKKAKTLRKLGNEISFIETSRPIINVVFYDLKDDGPVDGPRTYYFLDQMKVSPKSKAAKPSEKPIAIVAEPIVIHQPSDQSQNEHAGVGEHSSPGEGVRPLRRSAEKDADAAAVIAIRGEKAYGVPNEAPDSDIAAARAKAEPIANKPLPKLPSVPLPEVSPEEREAIARAAAPRSPNDSAPQNSIAGGEINRMQKEVSAVLNALHVQSRKNWELGLHDKDSPEMVAVKQRCSLDEIAKTISKEPTLTDVTLLLDRKLMQSCQFYENQVRDYAARIVDTHGIVPRLFPRKLVWNANRSDDRIYNPCDQVKTKSKRKMAYASLPPALESHLLTKCEDEKPSSKDEDIASLKDPLKEAIAEAPPAKTPSEPAQRAD